MHAPLISVIIPTFNEESNVALAYEAVVEKFKDFGERFRLEIIFTDNHSTDRTFNILQDLAKSDTRVKVVRFTRNFGFNKSLLTGYRLSEGDAAIQLDCDLQDPPSLFDTFLRHWQNGHDVVVGIRTKRPEPRLLLFARKLFYRFLNMISEDNLIVDGGDFRLVDRSILDQLREINDATPYVRGLISTLAANQIGIPYERSPRTHGKSKFPLSRLFWLAIDGIISHSTMPLRLASLTGFAISILTMLMAAGYFLSRLFFGHTWPAGFATEITLILFGISLNAIFLGIIGEYVARIYQQLRQRPLTITERMINIGPTRNRENKVG